MIFKLSGLRAFSVNSVVKINHGVHKEKHRETENKLYKALLSYKLK